MSNDALDESVEEITVGRQQEGLDERRACDRCQESYDPVLTDGRCPACGHDDVVVDETGWFTRMLAPVLASPARTFALLLVVVVVEIILFVLVVTGS